MGTNIKSIDYIIEEVINIFNEYGLTPSNENLTIIMNYLNKDISKIREEILHNEGELITKKLKISENIKLINQKKQELHQLQQQTPILEIIDKFLEALIQNFERYKSLIITEEEFFKRTSLLQENRSIKSKIKREKKYQFLLSKQAKEEQEEIKQNNKTHRSNIKQIQEKLSNFEINRNDYLNLDSNIGARLTEFLELDIVKEFINIEEKRLNETVDYNIFKTLSSLMSFLKFMSINYININVINKFKEELKLIFKEQAKIDTYISNPMLYFSYMYHHYHLINSINDYVKQKGEAYSSAMRRHISKHVELKKSLEVLSNENKKLSNKISEQEFIVDFIKNERKKLIKKELLINKVYLFINFEDSFNKLLFTTKYYKCFSDEELGQFEQELDNYMLKLKI